MFQLVLKCTPSLVFAVVFQRLPDGNLAVTARTDRSDADARSKSLVVTYGRTTKMSRLQDWDERWRRNGELFGTTCIVTGLRARGDSRINLRWKIV